MSRIGKMPITVPAGVDFKLDGTKVTVKGPNGTLSRELHKDMIVKYEGGVVTVERPSDDKSSQIIARSYKNTCCKYGDRRNGRLHKNT